MMNPNTLSKIALGASIIAVVVTGAQFGVQYIEYENTVRPIIVVNGFDPDSKILSFIYENFGPVPNTDGTISLDVDRNGYDIERLRNNPDTKDRMQIVAPTQQIGHTIELTQFDLDMTVKGAPLFIGILIEYHHNDRSYEYGTILKYSESLEDFAIVESWIK